MNTIVCSFFREGYGYCDFMTYDLFAFALKAICLGDDVQEQNHKGKDYPSNKVMKEVAPHRIRLYLGQGCERQGQRFSANSHPPTLSGICSSIDLSQNEHLSYTMYSMTIRQTR